MQDDTTPMAFPPEVIDLTTCTTPEPELVHAVALKRDKSKFNIWSLPPAPGSAHGLVEVKQNQASLPSQPAPVTKKKKKDKKKQASAASQAKGRKLKDRTLRVAEKHVGRVLRLIYDPASSVVDIEFYFKNLARSNGTILDGPQGEEILKCLDTVETEKKAFARLSQMAGLDIIEPVLQWGFVGRHLRVVREERGHLNITERFTVRIERLKKQDLPRADPRPLSLAQTEFDSRPSPAVTFCSDSPATRPDVISALELIPYRPSMASYVPASPSASTHHMTTMALACSPEREEVAETAENQSRLAQESPPYFYGDVTVLEDHLQVMEQLGQEIEESTTEAEVKLRLRMADDELQASCKGFLDLERERLNLTRKGPSSHGSFDPLVYCRLLEDMRTNTERSQEAIKVAQGHAERLYHVRAREKRVVLERSEGVTETRGARIQQVKERERQLALEQADTFLEALGDTWGRGDVSPTET